VIREQAGDNINIAREPCFEELRRDQLIVLVEPRERLNGGHDQAVPAALGGY